MGVAVSLCPEHDMRAAMTDEEFWDHVARQHAPDHEPDHEPDPEDYPEMIVGWCLRCGGNLIAEDYQQLRRIIDEDRELCDDCADELLPDIEAMDPA